MQLRGSAAFRAPGQNIAMQMASRPVSEDGSDSGSCHSVLSSSSSGAATATGRKRGSATSRPRKAHSALGMRDNSTVCSSGFSDILLPAGSGPVLQSVLSVRRRQSQEEYLLKLRGRSYAKARWWTKDEAMHTLDVAKLQRGVKKFLSDNKVEPFVDYEPDAEPFPAMYRIHQRVVSVSCDKALILWRGLDYNTCTWEHLHEVPPTLLERYKLFQKRRIASPKETVVLRPYQSEGVAWLVQHHAASRGAILADDMGLGKTAQTISFLCELLGAGKAGPFLVVAPKSLLPQWVDELVRWSGMNVVCYSGGIDSRKIIVEFEMLTRSGSLRPNVVVTNYENLADKFNLSLLQWEVAVFDEAQRLKNPGSILYGVARRVQSKCKILLTGTPVQNNMEELWALLHLCHPRRFTREVKADFSDMLDKKALRPALQTLRESTHPYILRRTKDAVLRGEIPDRTDTHINLELTAYQRIMYAQCMERSDSALMGSGRRGNLLTALRSVCSHPYLIEGTREKAEARLAGGASGLPPVIACSAKMIVLDKVLRQWRAEGRKVLLFSQWRTLLDIIEECLQYRGWQWSRLDGSVSSGDRQLQISRFNNTESPDPFVFLLTTRAGGTGLNLTVADRVVIFDTDWNPQQDLQAAARCHRIGQDKEVKIFRFVTRHTIEERMVEVASRKLALSSSVLGEGAQIKDDEEELRAFLKRGALKLQTKNAAAADDLLIDSSAESILDRAHQGLAATGMEDIRKFSEIHVSAAEVDGHLERTLLLPSATEVAPTPAVAATPRQVRAQAGSPCPVAPSSTPRLMLFSSRKRSRSQSETQQEGVPSPGVGVVGVGVGRSPAASLVRASPQVAAGQREDEVEEGAVPRPRLELRRSKPRGGGGGAGGNVAAGGAGGNVAAGGAGGNVAAGGAGGNVAAGGAGADASPLPKRPRLELRRSGTRGDNGVSPL